MKKLPIAITLGEPAGIGVDLLLQFACEHPIDDLVVITDRELLNHRAKLLKIPNNIPEQQMIHVAAAIKAEKMPARMILQVHDELILEVREDAAQDAAALVKKEMEGVYPLSVPLVVDTAVGKNWEEAH